MNILNKLTIKHLTMNKKRTIVSIVGIVLSTALMVGIGLLLSTFRELMIDDITHYNGDYHASIVDVDTNKLSIIENNSNVDSLFYRQYIGYSLIENENEEYSYKPYYKLYGASSSYFDTLELLEGTLPNNTDEIVISKNIETEGGLELKVGSTITLNLGDRYLDGEELNVLEYTQGEILGQTTTKTYTIVGIVSRDIQEDYSSAGYSIFTKIDSTIDKDLTVFIKYNKPAKSYKISASIASSLGFKSLDADGEEYEEISYNDSLLSMYGASKYDNMMGGMIGMLSIMLGLVSIACIIVIYNSFAISVMERKKQFGLFSSIGATKKQIKKTVLFEALIVSIIGIPLGILSAYLGIGIVVLIMNNLIGDLMGMPMHLCTYPMFILVPILFMIITIFVSAFLPAKKASKISPIEAIRLNDDIKIKGKKVKSPKWINKFFGIEGVIAYKNMKRNKKKYRITVASLFISIVLFISFSGYLAYALVGTSSYLSVPEFDIELEYSDTIDSDIIETIKSNEDVKESVSYKMMYFSTTTDLKDMYTDKYRNFLEDKEIELSNNIIVLVLDDETYNTYLKKIGKKEAKPIIYNKYSGIVYSTNSRKGYTYDRFNTDKLGDINISNEVYDEESAALDPENYEYEMQTVDTISDYYVTTEDLLSLEILAADTTPIIILNSAQATNYKLEDINNILILKTPSYKNIDKVINDYIDGDKIAETDSFYYINIAEEMKMMKNLILVMKILIYGFITLVTLIGVTSVFNTINTSIALRRKEFAVLRSIGLTPKGFNKTLRFESLFFGLKSLLYGLPVSFGILYLLHLSMNNIVELGHMLIPWGSVLVAVLGVFVVIGLSMIYATKRMKNENILDAIREENI